jgi:hypothetical protein
MWRNAIEKLCKPASQEHTSRFKLGHFCTYLQHKIATQSNEDKNNSDVNEAYHL